jgi:uncharacterized membrane protein
MLAGVNSPVPAAADTRIQTAIQAAERRTSGEVRVFVSRQPAAEPHAAARTEFERLDMRRTPLRNALLLHVAGDGAALGLCADESLELRAGEELRRAVPAAFAAELAATGDVPAAIVAAVAAAAEILAATFPKHSADRNDLPNAVVRE